MEENETKSISSILRDAIRTKGIGLEKLAQLTGISERHLGMFVEEKFEKLPSAPYTHGYLIRVANALGLDGQELWANYLKNNEILRRSGEKDYLPRNRFEIKTVNKRWIVPSLILVIVLTYISFRVVSFYSEPEISLNFENGTILRDSKFNLLGNINSTDQLTLNGEIVYSDEKGNFEKSLELNPGFNTLTFKVKRLLGKEFTITKQIFYEPRAEQKTPFPTNF